VGLTPVVAQEKRRGRVNKAAASPIPKEQDPMPRIRRVGHRGAGAHEPQNTLRSFERAIAMGVDMVETDVRRCQDGCLVLAHDDTISEGDRELVVAESDLAALRSLDLGHGERIPLLEELFEVARGRCALMLDLKGEGFERALIGASSASGLPREQVVVPGGSPYSRVLIRHLDPAIPLSLSLGAEWQARLNDAVIDAIDTDAVTWHHSLITPERVARLHERGLFVYAWTVDDVATMRRVVDAGVDGVITNRPELFASDDRK
jgi:glycerophosphoryl diester phosphodiesterase